MQHPVTSTGKGHSWQAITGHHVGSTRRGHSWRSVRGHPMTSTRRVHSWRPVTRHPVASTGKVQPVEAIPSPQLHVIEPVNRSWKTGREDAITCELCAYTTKRKEKYLEHLRCHITQRYICKICGRACLKVIIFVIFFPSLIAIIFILYFPAARPPTQQQTNDSRKDAEKKTAEKATFRSLVAEAAAETNSPTPENEEIVEIITDLGITIENQPDPAVVKRIRDFYNSEAKKAETAKCIRHLNVFWKTRKVRRFECASCYYQTDEPQKYEQHLQCHELQFTCKLCTRKCLEVNASFSWCLGVFFTFYFQLTLNLLLNLLNKVFFSD